MTKRSWLQPQGRSFPTACRPTAAKSLSLRHFSQFPDFRGLGTAAGALSGNSETRPCVSDRIVRSRGIARVAIAPTLLQRWTAELRVVVKAEARQGVADLEQGVEGDDERHGAGGHAVRVQDEGDRRRVAVVALEGVDEGAHGALLLLIALPDGGAADAGDHAPALCGDRRPRRGVVFGHHVDGVGAGEKPCGLAALVSRAADFAARWSQCTSPSTRTLTSPTSTSVARFSPARDTRLTRRQAGSNDCVTAIAHPALLLLTAFGHVSYFHIC